MSSAFGGFAYRPPPGLCPWTPLGDFCPQSPCFVPHRNKFLATSLVEEEHQQQQQEEEIAVHQWRTQDFRIRGVEVLQAPRGVGRGDWYRYTRGDWDGYTRWGRVWGNFLYFFIKNTIF